MYNGAPDSWPFAAPGPCLTLERTGGSLEAVAHPEDRDTVITPSGEQIVAGFGAAHDLAQGLATELD